MEEGYRRISDRLSFSDCENTHFIPDEIFHDIKKYIDKPPHLAFAYSYYYLISWLYRYVKYSELSIGVKEIKDILGYSPVTKTVDYIVKKDGVLDKAGYTFSTNNFPISVQLDDCNKPYFTLLRDLEKSYAEHFLKNKHTTFNIKYPVKHFHRSYDDCEENSLTGVFYNVANAHQMDFKIFLYCMGNEKIGTVGFYLYGYLKSKCKEHSNKYNVSLSDLESETKLSRRTLVTYLDLLRRLNMLTSNYRSNAKHLSNSHDKRKLMINTYIVNNYSLFHNKPKEYKKRNKSSQGKGINRLSFLIEGDRKLFFSGKRYYIYRFLNMNKEVLYVGKTKDIRGRMYTHFSNSHLDKKLYSEINKIEFQVVGSKAEMDIRELYYINLWKPAYNKKGKYDEQLTLRIKDKKWNEVNISELRGQHSYPKQI